MFTLLTWMEKWIAESFPSESRLFRVDSRMIVSDVRLSVLQNGNYDTETGDRGDGRGRKRKAPGQTEKIKNALHLYTIIVT